MRAANKSLSYDDVLLEPQFSDLDSRTEPKIESKIGGITLDLPIFSAPMDSVTESDMALFMYEQGGLGVIHRFNSINEQFSHVKWVKSMRGKVGAAVGVNGDSIERAAGLIEAGADLLVIDVAHGHSRLCLDFIQKIKANYAIPIMSGNIVTAVAMSDYAQAGADILRIGVGPGSACSTRQVAGVGVGQFSAIERAQDWRNSPYSRQHYPNISIVADGGIRSSGDAVKALAAGADAVMIGGLLAPFKISAAREVMLETDDPFIPVYQTSKTTAQRKFEDGPATSPASHRVMKEFRGMASQAALSNYKKDRDYVVEGESFLVPMRYDQKEFMNTFRDGIQTGFAYLGARNTIELREKAYFVEVTSNVLVEGTPHFKEVIR